MRYRIMAIKYGYMEVDVPDNNEKEALQLAENAPDTQYDWTKPYDHKIVESYTSDSSKKVVLIKGANAALKCGEPAVVYTMDDQILKTSPVVTYNVSGGQVYIETRHTVYRTCKEEEKNG